jgi:hypothetical protein
MSTGNPRDLYELNYRGYVEAENFQKEKEKNV